MMKFLTALLLIPSLALADGRIRDADIAVNAAIQPSKIAGGSWSGTAAKAVQLATTPIQCPGGQYASGINTFGDLTCSAVSGLPDQTGHSGQFLGTDGSVASWGTVVSGINQLTGDVLVGPGSGSQAAVVAFVGTSAASAVHTAEVAANAATASNTNSTIVLRNGSGNFAAGTITAALNGNALTATALAATPTKCSAGNYPLGVDASGNAVNCTAAASGSGDFSSNTSTSVDGEVVLFSGTGGKTGKRATGSGIAKLAGGVLGTATSGTDYAPATSGTAIQKGNGSGGFSSAVASTDYVGPTVGSAIQKASSGGLTAATGGTDYEFPLTFSGGITRSTNAISLSTMAAHTYKGNNTGSTAAPADVTSTQLTADLNLFTPDSGSGGLKGLVTPPAANDSVPGDKALGPDGNWNRTMKGWRNYVTNPGADMSVSVGITASGPTVTRNTTAPVGRNADFQFTFTATSQYVEWALESDFATKDLKNGLCEAEVWYTAASDYVQLQAYRNSAAIGSVTLGATTNPTPGAIYFPCGDGTNATTLRAVALSSTSNVVHVGKLYAGEARAVAKANLGASILGKVTITGASSCTWNMNQFGSWANYSANSSCNLGVTNYGSRIQPAATKIPGFQLLNAEAGKKYEVIVGGAKFRTGNGSDNCSWQLSNGTDVSGGLAMTSSSGGMALSSAVIPFTVSGTQIVQIQNRNASAGDNCGIETATAILEDLTFIVKEVPDNQALINAATQSGDYDGTLVPFTFSAGFGTVSTQKLYGRKVNDRLYVDGYFIPTSPAASGAYLILPSNLQVDYTKQTSGIVAKVGDATGLLNSSTNLNVQTNILYTDGTSTSNIYAGFTTNGNSYGNNTGSSMSVSGNIVDVHFSIPLKNATKSTTSANITGDPGVWSGYHDTTCSWATTASSYSDPTADTSCNFVQRQNMNFGTVTGAGGASALPGIVFTPKLTGLYHVCAYAKGFLSTTAYGDFKLWDGTTVIHEGEVNTSSTTEMPLCGTVSAVAGVSSTLKIQMKVTTGSVTLLGSTTNASTIEWEIFPITQNLPGWLSNPAPTDEFYIDGRGASSFGSTNTTAIRFNPANIRRNVGNVTYADSSTLGATFTIGTAGLYTVVLGVSGTSLVQSFAITVNGTNLSTIPQTPLTYAQGLRGPVGYTGSNGARQGTTWTGHLNVGDIVRGQADSAVSIDDNAMTSMNIVRINN